MRVRPDTVFSLLSSKVARRMLTIFLLCAFLPVCVLGGLSLWQVSRKLQNETYQRVRHASKNAGMSLLEALSVVSSELETIADLTVLREQGRWPQRADKEKYDQVRLRGLTFFDGEGRPTVLFGEPSPRLALTDRMRSHLASGKALLFVSEENQAPRMWMALSTSNPGGGKGLLVGEVNQAYLWEAAARALPPGMEVSVLLGSTQVLFSPLPLSPQAIANEDGNIFAGHAGEFQWSGQDDTYLSGYWTANFSVAYLAHDWIIMASEPRSQAFSSLQRFTRLFLAVLLLMLLVVLLLSFMQIRKNLVPLASLKEGTQRIARGDLESLVRVQSGDEFEELAHAFNRMSDNLRHQFQNLNQMGRMVRTILTSLDRTSIIESVLNEIRTVVQCDWATLLFLKTIRKGEVDTHCIDNRRDDVQRFQRRCILSVEQARMLERASDAVTEGADGLFASLTLPLAERGARSFVILPIRTSQRVIGALVLGYAGTSTGSREDLVRGRQLADHIASAISNADLLDDLAELNLGTLTALARAVDANSPWTAGHSERVTAVALQVASVLDLPKKEIELLNRAGLLHDLGKIGVPGAILDKPGKLTEEEWVIIREHPGKGALILEPIPAFREVVPLVAQHHERFDGSGYPLGLAGPDISLGARILAVADVYDALISDRPYRAGWELQEVRAFIESEASVGFDPNVVRAFRSLKLEAPDQNAPKQPVRPRERLRIAQ